MIWKNTFVNADGTWGFGQGCYTKQATTPDPVAFAIETGAVGFIAHKDTGAKIYDLRGSTFEENNDDVYDTRVGFEVGTQCRVVDGTLTFGRTDSDLSIQGGVGFRGVTTGALTDSNWIFFYGGSLTTQEKAVQANVWTVHGGPSVYLKTIAKTVGANSEDVYTITDQDNTPTEIPTARYYVKTATADIQEDGADKSIDLDVTGIVNGEEVQSTVASMTLNKTGNTHTITVENAAGDTITDSWTEGGGSGETFYKQQMNINIDDDKKAVDVALFPNLVPGGYYEAIAEFIMLNTSIAADYKYFCASWQFYYEADSSFFTSQLYFDKDHSSDLPQNVWLSKSRNSTYIVLHIGSGLLTILAIELAIRRIG